MAQAHQIPNLMKEIGRLREITFRMAGEGTGKACDNDRFDSHYVHLFLWDGDRHEVAGGYRLGLTDEILMRHGKRGLYSRTLFQYGCRFLDRINPAIELGRSFVSPKYQRSYQPLMLLWKGIGVFVSRNPHYRMLFGPVSITSDYHAISRDLIVAYLKRYKKRTDLARFVKARNPLREDSLGARELKLALQHLDQGTGDMKDLSEMVSEMEAGQKGIPILLKHYVNLGGEFLGFSIDPDFRNAIDALILVDLCRTDPRLLERYMGSGPATRFLRYHYDKCLAQCA
jgi:putative hemolysin